jgi:hypothetical protein
VLEGSTEAIMRGGMLAEERRSAGRAAFGVHGQSHCPNAS